MADNRENVEQLRDALQAMHDIAAAGFASGGTFGDLVGIESIARHALRDTADNVEVEHAIESWFVGAERGFFACSCGKSVTVDGYLNDSVEAALERHIAASDRRPNNG